MILMWCGNLYSQDFFITEPELQFDGYKLSVTYDLISNKASDIFFIKVDIRNMEGVPIRADSFEGEVGDSISPGDGKRIVWIPERDARYLNEDVTVELLAEKYERTFNKAAAVLFSTVIPGLGQVKTGRSKSWLLAGIPVYGTLATGIVVNQNYQETYDAYDIELDPIERADLYSKSMRQRNISYAMFLSSALIWAANITWVGVTPNEFKPLQIHLVADKPAGSRVVRPMLSLRYNF